MMEINNFPTQEQEDQWEQEKQACYARWSEGVIKNAVAWIGDVYGARKEHRKAQVKKKYGDSIYRDVLKILNGRQVA